MPNITNGAWLLPAIFLGNPGNAIKSSRTELHNDLEN